MVWNCIPRKTFYLDDNLTIFFFNEAISSLKINRSHSQHQLTLSTSTKTALAPYLVSGVSCKVHSMVPR